MSVVQNFGQFLEITGPERAPVAWFLATVDWPDEQTRNEFAALLRGA